MNFDAFITYLISEKRSSPHTVEAYASDLRQFADFASKEFQIDAPEEVSAPVVRSWLASMMEDAYASSSVHRKLSSLQAYYRFMLRHGWVKSNPVKGISKPKMAKRLPTFVDERGAMLLYDENVRREENVSDLESLIVTLFYETGIRLSELLQLRDRDVDFSQKQIKVTGKRNKMRLVPVSDAMLERIRSYMRSRKAGSNTPELFRDNNGEKLTKSFVYKTVKHYLSGVTTLKKKSPHILRHSFATHMLNNGADLNVIKEILGHSSLAATQVYTHNSIEKLRSIHQQMHPRSK